MFGVVSGDLGPQKALAQIASWGGFGTLWVRGAYVGVRGLQKEVTGYFRCP